jgi:hypothetical protein
MISIEMGDLKGFMQQEFSRILSNTEQAAVDAEILSYQMMQINTDHLTTT